METTSIQVKTLITEEEWLVERVKHLSSLFAIEIAAYAIMSNHYHLVVKVNKTEALEWSEEEVINRWYQLYKSNNLIDRYMNEANLDDATKMQCQQLIELWRTRLYDISWYMKNLNEYIARQANKEDNCTGKYWEGRYSSQALLDETALLSCMAYVDSNPIRAGIATNLQDSDFTSIQERLAHFNTPEQQSNTNQSTEENYNNSNRQQPPKLKPFSVYAQTNTLPFNLMDYIELVDWTGRQVHPKKKGYIGKDMPKVLATLNVEKADWLEKIQSFREHYAHFVGNKHTLKQLAVQNDSKWYKGTG